MPHVARAPSPAKRGRSRASYSCAFCAEGWDFFDPLHALSHLKISNAKRRYARME